MVFKTHKNVFDGSETADVTKKIFTSLCGHSMTIELKNNAKLVGIFSINGNHLVLPNHWTHKTVHPPYHCIYLEEIRIKNGNSNDSHDFIIRSKEIKANTKYQDKELLWLRQCQIMANENYCTSNVMRFACVKWCDIKCLKYKFNAKKLHEKSNTFQVDAEIKVLPNSSFRKIVKFWNDSDSKKNSKVNDDWMNEKPDAQWDQFEANEKQFGLKSTFDENMYTSKLNLEKIPESYRAKAVELGSKSNYDEEESCEDDEEKKFSAVTAPSSIRAGRNQYKSNQQEQNTTQTTPSSEKISRNPKSQNDKNKSTSSNNKNKDINAMNHKNLKFNKETLPYSTNDQDEKKSAKKDTKKIEECDKANAEKSRYRVNDNMSLEDRSNLLKNNINALNLDMIIKKKPVVQSAKIDIHKHKENVVNSFRKCNADIEEKMKKKGWLKTESIKCSSKEEKILDETQSSKISVMNYEVKITKDIAVLSMRNVARKIDEIISETESNSSLNYYGSPSEWLPSSGISYLALINEKPAYPYLYYYVPYDNQMMYY